MQSARIFALWLLASQIALPSVHAQALDSPATQTAPDPSSAEQAATESQAGTESQAAQESQIAAVQAADDQRIALMRSPDREKLARIFSDDLRYAHSTGVVDTKASFLELLVSGKSRYLGYDHQDRIITIPAPGIALIAGRARLQTESAAGKMDNVLSYLAVWREEHGQWRFLAWQSCRLPLPANP